MDDAAAAAASDVATSSTNRPRSYLIIHNIGKKHNIGTIVRSAVAFGVTQVCLVGSKRYNAFGSHGSVDYMDLRHFDTLALARNYLKDECGCTIVGVEIAEGAAPIHKHPFSGSCAFMLGNEVCLRDRWCAISARFTPTRLTRSHRRAPRSCGGDGRKALVIVW